MSSSQQQLNNPNDNQSQNTNPNPQIPPNDVSADYEDDPSLRQYYYPTLNDQLPHMISGFSYDSTGQPYPNNHVYSYTNEQYAYDNSYNEDDDFPIELEDELEAEVEKITNEQLTGGNEDEVVYTDDVQNAFEKYENEAWHSTSDEENDMFEEMNECMRYMEQEYSIAEMPHNLIESMQTSQLNPDAAEFRPSNSQSTTTATDKTEIVVLSWMPCEAKKQDEQKDS